MNKKIVLKSLFYLLVACLCVLWLLPMVFVVLSAVKTNADFYDHPLLTLPASVHCPISSKRQSGAKYSCI